MTDHDPAEILRELDEITPWPWALVVDERHKEFNIVVADSGFPVITNFWWGDKKPDMTDEIFITRAPERLKWACEEIMLLRRLLQEKSWPPLTAGPGASG